VASTGRRTVTRTPRGLYSLAREYYGRYHIPLFHCETNRVPRFAEQWLDEQWADMMALRRSGIPVYGFTWYSLTDQIDWQHALRVERNDLHPVGLYDLQRRIRPVGAAYRDLVARWAAPLKHNVEPETLIAIA
jgi:beta-glucosidase/6-phospho-beta-glucosidase/beta-galactosidase